MADYVILFERVHIRQADDETKTLCGLDIGPNPIPEHRASKGWCGRCQQAETSGVDLTIAR